MRFQLWDHASGNLLGAYATEAEALDVVAAIVGQYKSRRARAVAWLTLLTSDPRAGTTVVTAGQALAELARRRAERSEPPPGRGAAAPAARRKRAAA